VTSLVAFLSEVEPIAQQFTPPGVDWYVSPWFRGHADIGWPLEPGWHRQAPPGRKKGDAWYNEHNLLQEFKLDAPRYLAAMPATDWEWLFVMQHYGLPTRLLDWTESALLGLYFALRDHDRGTDAGVWVLNPWWLNNRSLGGLVLPGAGEPAVRPWAPRAAGSMACCQSRSGQCTARRGSPRRRGPSRYMAGSGVRSIR